MAISGGNKGGGRAKGMRGPRGVSSAVRLRKEALDDVAFIVADGLMEVGRMYVEAGSANAPDSPLDPYPLGEGLPKQGGVLAYVGGQKVDGWSLRGVQPKKPRALRTPAKQHAIVVGAGFGFPARFVQGGTINHAPRPFFGPGVSGPDPSTIPAIVGDLTRPRINRGR